MRFLIPALMLTLLPAAAQEKAVQFTSTAQLVIETVTVKDKSGRPVEGLTAKDFTITEDGVPQSIRFFEFQKLETGPAAPLGAPQPRPDTTYVRKLVGTQIAPAKPGETKYRDRRLLALYFDMSSMPVPDQMRSFRAAQKFIRTQMTTIDLMAIMTFSNGAVRVLQDFTDDRYALENTLQTLILGEDQESGDTLDDASTPDSGAAFGQDDAEFNVFNTDRQLAALQTAARALGRLSEKKSLICFASGIRLNGTNNQAQLHATINAAIRANVALYTIDARGLVAQAPMGDASKGSQGGLAMYTGSSAAAVTANLQRSQDTLWTLAADTGGKALLDYNDLSAGIVNAQQASASYYLIGYYTTNESLNGKFRRIRVTLNNGLAASLDYRQGYYAGKVFSKFTATDKERQLEDALMLEDPVTELTIAMEVGYFQLNRAEYFVPVAVKIPGSELARAKRRGAEHTLLDFIGEIRDEFGTTIANVRDKIDIRLTDATAAELAKRPIQYDSGFTLLPGNYRIKLLARDAETGRIGTYEMKFLVPNLNKEDKRVPISSVVLSSQRVDLRDALFNAAKDKGKSESANPLVQDGQKLVPSITRVFSASRDMHVYLQAYEAAAADPQPLIAYVSFYRGSEKALETQPISVARTANSGLKTLPLQFDITLNTLPPGEYQCQVTVLNPQGQKAAFWQAPVMMVP